MRRTTLSLDWFETWAKGATENSHSIEEFLKKPIERRSPTTPVAAEMQETVRRALNPFHDYNSAISKALNPLQNSYSAAFAEALNPMQSMLKALSQKPLVDMPKFDPFPPNALLAMKDIAGFGAMQQDLANNIMRTSGWAETIQAFDRQRGALGRLFGSILQSAYARSTQDFLATSEGLRYTSNRSVWHYTSGYVLLQVAKNNVLWSSSPQSLNDSSEVTHGIRIIKQSFKDALAELRNEADENGQPIREKIKEATRKQTKRTVKEVLDKDYFKTVLNEIYIISASADRDSLTLFRNYANGDGFAIGLDPRVELSAGGFVLDPDDDDTEVRDGIPPINGWYRVHYTSQSKKKVADEFVANAIKDIKETDQEDLPFLVAELRRHILILASTMKHDAFRDEREVRYITTNWSPLDGLIHYEYGRNGIVPVLHIRTSSENKDEPLPLRGVRCSPGAPAGIGRTIEGFLMQQGHKKASKDVRKSNQPFKG